MSSRTLLISLAALVTGTLSATASADLIDRLYDFKDSYYLKNGVNPALISGRRQAVAPLAVQDSPIRWFQRDVRALMTFPAYDHSSNPWYFTVLGGLNTSAFTPDSAGTNAKVIADRSPEYVFPKVGFDPMGLGGGRQSNLLDMRNGYFSNNPLGLWIHVWINFTTKATSTYGGQQMLRDLASRNGVGEDGFPIIKTVGQIDNLFSKGYITKSVRPDSDALRYAICPVVKDPTDGGIAQDQWLSYSKRADGSPVEPRMVRNFEELRLNGRWYNK